MREKGQGKMLAKRLAKGFFIGASMLIPGVSGGTMAIILGVYDELIHAVSCFLEDARKNSLMLLEFLAAGLLGVVLLSEPMLYALNRFERPMLFFFMGAILGSLPPLYEKASISRLKWTNIVASLLGIGCGTMLKLLPSGMFEFDGKLDMGGYMLLFGAGLIIAVALILPGISASYVLLMMGMYHRTLFAIRHGNIAYLAPIALGTAAGAFFTADVLERAMKRHPPFTYMLIIGFMLGSLFQVFPGLPEGAEWISCLGAGLIGMLLIFFAGYKGSILK